MMYSSMNGARKLLSEVPLNGLSRVISHMSQLLSCDYKSVLTSPDDN